MPRGHAGLQQRRPPRRGVRPARLPPLCSSSQAAGDGPTPAPPVPPEGLALPPGCRRDAGNVAVTAATAASPAPRPAAGSPRRERAGGMAPGAP